MKFPECEDCANFDTDPAICDDCLQGENFEPYDEDYDLANTAIKKIIQIKEIAA